MGQGGNGSGPGGHPGVELMELTGDKTADKALWEAALEAIPNPDFIVPYVAGGKSLAALVHGYKDKH